MVGHLAPRTEAILLVLLGLAIIIPVGLLVVAYSDRVYPRAESTTDVRRRE